MYNLKHRQRDRAHQVLGIIINFSITFATLTPKSVVGIILLCMEKHPTLTESGRQVVSKLIPIRRSPLPILSSPLVLSTVLQQLAFIDS
jgi:hypothetical protein